MNLHTPPVYVPPGGLSIHSLLNIDIPWLVFFFISPKYIIFIFNFIHYYIHSDILPLKDHTPKTQTFHSHDCALFVFNVYYSHYYYHATTF